MKVYEKVVISMETGETVYEESYKYNGEVSECKGGGSGYDAEYNSKLAALAEKEFGLSEIAFNSWNRGGARELEEGTAKAGLSLLPAQTNLASAQIDSMASLLPGQTALSGAQTALGLKSTANKSSIMDKFYASLGKNDESSAMNEAGSLTANAFSNAEGSARMDMSRRGLSYKPSVGLSAEKAKAIGGAQSTALKNTRAQNISELAQGLTI